jgi:hypothetical protein
MFGHAHQLTATGLMKDPNITNPAELNQITSHLFQYLSLTRPLVAQQALTAITDGLLKLLD